MKSQQPYRRLAIVTGANHRRGIGVAVCHALAQAGIGLLVVNSLKV